MMLQYCLLFLTIIFSSCTSFTRVSVFRNPCTRQAGTTVLWRHLLGTKQRKWSPITTSTHLAAAAAAAGQPPPSLPTNTTTTAAAAADLPIARVVGVFLDLDNIVPMDNDDGDGSGQPYTRASVAAWIRPLKDFCHAVGEVDVMRGYGNTHTQNFRQHAAARGAGRGKEEFNQEWWKHNKNRNNENEDSSLMLFPGAMVQTGYDEEGFLRCGICGAKMKLSKKDLMKGLDVHGKLEKHMRSLHDREQAKRVNLMKSSRKKKKLSEKEMKKFSKYKAAQVGLDRRYINASGKIAKQRKNDLFQILKEERVQCISSKDVDATLIRHASKWITNQRRWINNKGSNSKETMNDNKGSNREETMNDHGDHRVTPRRGGVLVVGSADSDFVPLYERAKASGILVVSANPNEITQTKALINACDVVLIRGKDGQGKDCLVAKAASNRGTKLLLTLESTYYEIPQLDEPDSEVDELSDGEEGEFADDQEYVLDDDELYGFANDYLGGLV